MELLIRTATTRAQSTVDRVSLISVEIKASRTSSKRATKLLIQIEHMEVNVSCIPNSKQERKKQAISPNRRPEIEQNAWGRRVV